MIAVGQRDGVLGDGITPAMVIVTGPYRGRRFGIRPCALINGEVALVAFEPDDQFCTVIQADAPAIGQTFVDAVTAELERWPLEACDEDPCPGWVINGDDGAIQRCDTCTRFGDDDDACSHVLKLLRAERAALTVLGDRR